MARKTMGRVYIVGNSPNYFAEYRVEGKRFRQMLRNSEGKVVTDRQEAEKLLADILNPFNLHDRAERARQLAATVDTLSEKIEKAEELLAPPPLSVADAWDIFSEGYKSCGERTMKHYKTYWRQFADWLPTLPSPPKYLQDVTDEMVGAFFKNLAKSGLAAGTRNKRHDLLKLVFDKLRKPAKITGDNPVAVADCRVKDHQNERRSLTIDEIRHITNAAEGDLQLLLFIGASCGMRLGDAATLEWGEVDLATRTLRFIPNKISTTTGRTVKVGLPEFLAVRLAETPPDKRTGYVMPGLAAKYVAQGHSLLSRRIQEHFEACGVRTHRLGTGRDTGKRAVIEVGYHSLRHSYVELQAQIGTAEHVIQKQVGHSSPRMTEAYGGVTTTAALNAAAGMAQLLGQGATDGDGAERQRLAGLAMTSDIERVKRALAIMEE